MERDRMMETGYALLRLAELTNFIIEQSKAKDARIALLETFIESRDYDVPV